MKTRFFLYMFSLVVYALQVSANDDNWDFNPYAYQYDMTAYVSLSIDGNSVNNYSGYEIAAFCGEECRGKAENKTVNGHEYLYLRVRSNKTEGEVISFMVRNLTTGRISKAAETLIFKSQGTVGYPSSPFLLSALSQYIATFIIDGESQSSMLSYGDAIVPPVVPEKKGYTFDGWVPEVETTMPDHDVTYTAVYVANQYTISFDTDGGSEIDPITQDYNTAVTTPAEPTKVGHTFAGWDREMPQTMPAEDITIKALWTVNQYTISFDTDGGSEIAPITQDYNTAVTPPANPTKVGHTFAGWDREIPTNMPAEDVTIKAVWTVNQYTISFDTDGGSEIDPITQDYNTAVTMPAEPTKVGHTFVGWDREIPTNMPAEDITIKALWTVNKYTISFDTDGGSEIDPITQDYNTAVTTPAEPTKVGHTFAGWDREIPTNMPAEDITIKVLWTVNKYTISFDTDGGSEIAPITQDYNTAVTPPANPTKVGHTFAGWDREMPQTMPAEDITIKALWTVNKYTISFDTDGGSEIAPITKDYNTAVTPPAEPTKVGHTFAGWDREMPQTMPAEDITIKALWTVNKYTISFDTDGGSEIDPITQDYNTAVTPPADPTKVGHTFAGWDREIPQTMPAEDITIKAVWTVNMYKVSFFADGEVITEETLAYGSQITPPAAPEKEGYTFAGWKDVPEAMPANDIEIYGTYTVNAYKLTYQVDGTVYKEYTIEYGTEIVPEAIPAKEGHRFSGWQGLPDIMPAQDVVVSGTFSINSFNAVFIIGEDVIETRTIVYGQPVTPPEAPEKEGHTFAGWKDVPETMPAHDIEIYGTYTVNAYKLTVFLDDVIYMEEMLEYGAPIIIPVPEVPEGTKFDGWTTDIPETMPAYDLEIYGTTSVHTGIRGIIDVEQGECSVYDIKGHLLFKNISAKGIPNKLSKGLYIINGKKVLIR